MIRAGNDQFIRELYARLGPEGFWERRLRWLRANGKTVSLRRLISYLERAGFHALLAREGFSTPPNVRRDAE
jgi:hypothetical protein